MLTVVLTLLALAALGVIVAVVVPKFPLLASLQLEESPKARWRRLKQHIFVGRLVRALKAKLPELQRRVFTKERRVQFQETVRVWHVKLKALEERYRVETKEHQVQILLERARKAIPDDPEDAEQKFLEVVRQDARNLEAYEGLLQIYLARKSLSEAAEVVDFLKKLNPASAGKYSFDLAKLFLEGKELAKAKKYGEQALKNEPGNPKYLDFLIETVILEGDSRVAEKYLEKLKEVNPENAKIAEFADRMKNAEGVPR